MDSHPVEYLISIADYCDKLGFSELSDDIDKLAQSGGFTKVSQYVGVIGYALKGRAIQNCCVRSKRSSPEQPMQEIVMGCLKEYQDGLDYNDEDWMSKYANKNVKAYVYNVFKEGIKKGISPENISRRFIEDLTQKNDLSKEIEQLKSLWAKIKSVHLDKNAEFKELKNIVKEAQNLGLWQGVKNLWRKLGPGGGENKQVSGNLAEIQQNLQIIIRQISSLLPEAKRIGQLLGVEPSTNYDGFYNALQTAAQKTASKWTVNYLEKEAIGVGQLPPSTQRRLQQKRQNAPGVNLSQPPQSSTLGTQPSTQVQPVNTQQVDPQAAQTILSNLDQITKSFTNISNLLAKLQTFPSVTSNAELRQISQFAFDTFNEVYSGQMSPFNTDWLYKVVDAVGDLQQKINKHTSTTPVPSGTASPSPGTTSPAPTGPPAASPVQDALNVIQSLSRSEQQQLLQLLQTQLGAAAGTGSPVTVATP